LEDQTLLESFGVIIKKIKGVGAMVSNDPGPFDARTLAIYRAKIRALQLTEYNKILFVDLDAILLKNSDELFEIDHFTALSGSNSPFNAGFFVLSPSCQAFVDINDVASSDTFTVERGWNDYGPFPHWLKPNEMSDWSFYAAHAEQGLMFYYYNCYQKTGEMLPAGSWDEYSAHMVGSHKPWFYGKDGPSEEQIQRLPKRYRIATQLWYQVYLQVVQKIEETHPTMVNLVALSEQSVRTVQGPDPYYDSYCDHCKVSKWGKWSECSANCTQTRTRTITQEPTCGNTCPSLNETRSCKKGKQCRNTTEISDLSDWAESLQISAEKFISEFCESKLSATFDIKQCRKYVQKLMFETKPSKAVNKILSIKAKEEEEL